MNIKKKIKLDAMHKIDEALGEPQEAVVTSKRNIWPKVLIPVGAAALVVGAITGGIALGRMNAGNEFVRQHPYLQQRRTSLSPDAQLISAKSAEIYGAFVKNSAPKVLSNATESMSYSPFDAFVNFATLTYFSSDAISNGLLPLFGNPDLEELADAVYELTYALGTPSLYEQRYYGQNESVKIESGGYSANSLWTGGFPLKDDAEGKKSRETLMKRFLTSIIEEKPNAEDIVKWLENVIPEGYDIPKIEIPEGTDMALVSSYFLKVSNEDTRDYAYQQYLDGNHKMEYAFNGKTIQSDYLYYNTWHGCSYFVSEDLIGGPYPDLNLQFFLPKEETASPASLIDEVVNDAFEVKRAAWYDVSVPYFTIDEQRINLLESVYEPYCPAIVGIMEKVFVDTMVLTGLNQYSKVNLDYDGFASSSVTIATAEAVSAEEGIHFSLTVDRPFVFRNYKVVTLKDGTRMQLPTCIGVVFDPAYQAK